MQHTVTIYQRAYISQHIYIRYNTINSTRSYTKSSVSNTSVFNTYHTKVLLRHSPGCIHLHALELFAFTSKLYSPDVFSRQAAQVVIAATPKWSLLSMLLKRAVFTQVSQEISDLDYTLERAHAFGRSMHTLHEIYQYFTIAIPQFSHSSSQVSTQL